MVPLAFQSCLLQRLLLKLAGRYCIAFSAILLASLAGLGGCGSNVTLSSGSPVIEGPPVITSPSAASIHEGTSLGYQITATNNPTLYGATGLPSGLAINTSTGLVSGSSSSIGQYTALLTASNSFGQGTANLSIVVNSSPVSNCDSDAVVPSAALVAGFNTLVFCDDFNSISTIDVNGTGATGYNWYTTLPYGWGQTKVSAYSVANSILTVTSTGQTANWALSTMDPVSGNGREWKFGYMEARISFDPTLGPQSQGFPAVWASSAYNVLYGTGDGKYDIWPELDIFEAFTSGHTSYTGDFWGTLHQWQENSVSYTSTNNFQPTSVDWSQWHIVAVLWMQGHVTWYLDGAPLMTQKYSSQAPPDPLAATKTGITPTPAGVFNILDTQDMGMALILGSSPGWPMNVDWVRVWQE